MLRVGIVGLGVISEIHIDAVMRLHNLADLVAVCDCLPEKQKCVPEVPFYTDLETMLKEEKLDCLHICLPHYLHGWAARIAAKYHVNVFMEKPAGFHAEDVYELEKELREIQVGVCLQNRYNITTKKALEILQKETYGRLKGCKAVVTWDRRYHYYDKDPWRGKRNEAGGGVMLSQAIHTMDLMCLFCGKVQWVKGMIGNLFLENIEVEDTACAHIQFENQVSGIFYGSVTHCHNSSIELELLLEQGTLTIKENRLTFHQNGKEIILAEDKELSNGKKYYGAGHYCAIKEYYEMLEGIGGSGISLNQAAVVNELIDAIQESAREKQKVYCCLNN